MSLMNTDTEYKTDREAFADLLPSRIRGGFSMASFRAMEEEGLAEALRDGLDAFAALWFDAHEDETTLPDEFIALVRLAEDFGVRDYISERVAETPSLS